MAALPYSPTYTLSSLGPTAMARGRLKRAAVPCPFA
jgi:hypothetical protein